MINTLDEFLERFPDVQVTPEQLHACRFLERNGSRFLIDHGYMNAPSKAWDLIDPEGRSRESLEYNEQQLAQFKAVLFGVEIGDTEQW